LFDGDVKALLTLSPRTQKAVMASLSNLSKFLGVYDEWKAFVKAYGLKWSNGDLDMLVISRITKVRFNGDILEWIKRAGGEIPKLRLFLKFMLLTGLRLREAVNSWNLIIELSGKRKIGEYYNFESLALEHFRFKQLFIRRSKKCYITFLPPNLVYEIAEYGEPLTIFKVNNWVRRDKRLKSRFNDIREYWATYMTKWLTPAEIDFLQGRVGGSVFMRHYFNPALIADLRERVFKGLAELEKHKIY